VKIFAGYSGWSPGQLEEEMKRGAWLVHPASIDLVFKTEPKNLWQKIVGSKGWKFKLMSQSPDDLSWN
jgi:putative transcriptional regulator